MERRKFLTGGAAGGALAVIPKFGPSWLEHAWRLLFGRGVKAVERVSDDGSVTRLFDGFKSLRLGDRVRWNYSWPIPKEAPLVTVATPVEWEEGQYGFYYDDDQDVNRYYLSVDIAEMKKRNGHA